MTVVVEENLEDVEDFGHLSEDEDSMAACFPFTKEVEEFLEFPAIVLEEGSVGESDLVGDGRVVEGVEGGIGESGVGGVEGWEGVSNEISCDGVGRDDGELGDEFGDFLGSLDVRLDESVDSIDPVEVPSTILLRDVERDEVRLLTEFADERDEVISVDWGLLASQLVEVGDVLPSLNLLDVKLMLSEPFPSGDRSGVRRWVSS